MTKLVIAIGFEENVGFKKNLNVVMNVKMNLNWDATSFTNNRRITRLSFVGH
jgi:hypothetical protein